MADFLSSQPPPCSFYKVEFPTRHVLLVTINRATVQTLDPAGGRVLATLLVGDNYSGAAWSIETVASR